MILVDVVFLHSAVLSCLALSCLVLSCLVLWTGQHSYGVKRSGVTSGCRLPSEMSMTETTPENTESFSTRAFQATASIPNAEFTNFASKHCSEWWHNDHAPGAPCQSFAANTVSLFISVYVLAYSLQI